MLLKEEVDVLRKALRQKQNPLADALFKPGREPGILDKNRDEVTGALEDYAQWVEGWTGWRAGIAESELDRRTDLIQLARITAKKLSKS